MCGAYSMLHFICVDTRALTCQCLLLLLHPSAETKEWSNSDGSKVIANKWGSWNSELSDPLLLLFPFGAQPTVCLRVCVCMCACTCVCMYVCMLMYISAHAGAHNAQTDEHQCPPRDDVACPFGHRQPCLGHKNCCFFLRLPAIPWGSSIARETPVLVCIFVLSSGPTSPTPAHKPPSAHILSEVITPAMTS